MSMKEEMEAVWQTGFEYGLDRHFATKNTYRKDTWEYDSWLEGWKRGDQKADAAETPLRSYERGIADAKNLYESGNPYVKNEMDFTGGDHRSWVVGFLEFAKQEKCRLDNE